MFLSLARLMLKKLMMPLYRSYMDGDSRPSQAVSELDLEHHEDILPSSALHRSIDLVSLV